MPLAYFLCIEGALSFVGTFIICCLPIKRLSSYFGLYNINVKSIITQQEPTSYFSYFSFDSL